MQHQDNFLALVEEYRPHVKEVDVTYVNNKLHNQDKNWLLIDVREDYEWQHGHLPQAIHLARGIIERDIEKTVSDKNTEIVLYCGGGFRSVLAAYNLQKMGYKNVISMDGGYRDWLTHGFEVNK